MNRKNSIFQDVPRAKVRRNFFDLSHEVKMSGKFGLLMPVLLVDTLPGDIFKNQTTVFCRFAPMLAPVMHRIDVTVHYFFVPHRLLWSNWEEFITGGQDGTEAPVAPYLTASGIKAVDPTMSVMTKGRLWDYLGLPVFEGAVPADPEGETKISVLPFRAFGKIWNDYYRDPNFDEELDLDVDGDGDRSAATFNNFLMNRRRRMWERDYFTSALPFAQRGSEVLMPLAGNVAITYKNASDWATTPGGGIPAAGDPKFPGPGVDQTIMQDFAGSKLRVENIDTAEIANSEVSINDLRRSLAIQSWMETNARGGARYVEQVEAHFDVRVPDFRLQRAEYLGGGKQPVQISEVLATAESEDVPVGDLRGHGISVGKSNRFEYRCLEHGFIMGVMSVVPRTAYDQGIHKLWLRRDKFDYAFPLLAHIGEQEIKSRELFFSFQGADEAANDLLFGYIPRYSEYKFMCDRVAGDFRDNLAYWQLGRTFLSRPTLDELFTTMYDDGVAPDEEAYTRIFAVQDGTDYLWFQLFHRFTGVRPLPYFGVPKIQ